MNESPSNFRSPLLMNPDDSALLVIDMQEKLVPLIPNHAKITWNIGRLIRAASILEVSIAGTEQYPKGLGPTVPELSQHFVEQNKPLPPKTMFSCRECESLFKELSDGGIHNLVLTGIEAHVCVAQTALDMLSQGFNVFLCLDAIGSRQSLDRDVAIRRLENAGIIPTTTEAVMFEWCERAGNEPFKAISNLVQEVVPE